MKKERPLDRGCTWAEVGHPAWIPYLEWVDSTPSQHACLPRDWSLAKHMFDKLAGKPVSTTTAQTKFGKNPDQSQIDTVESSKKK